MIQKMYLKHQRSRFLASAKILMFALLAGLWAAANADAQSKEIVVIKPTFDLEEGALSSKTIWLGAKPTGTVTVDISVNNPSGVVVTTDKSTLTYNPSTYGRGQHVLFTAVNDADTNAGTVTVTLTANGGGYSNVTKTLSVTVIETTDANNNVQRAGIAVTKPSAEVTEGYTVNISVRPTLQPLGAATITATSSDAGAATVTASKTYYNTSLQNFTVTAVQDADALDESVTITFSSTYEWEYVDPTDPTKKARKISTVSLDVAVTVNDDDDQTNSAPTVSSAIADQYMGTSGTHDVALGSVFSDSDTGDTLTYEASSGSDATATVSISGSTLTITAVRRGKTLITVTAIDSKGASVADEFWVTLGVLGGGTLTDKNLNVGDSATYDLKKRFNGPSTMTFSASSSNDTNVGTSISSGVLTVSAKAAGSATITVTASGSSDSKSASFTVNVNTPPVVANAISDVTLANGGSTTVSLANVFSDADNDALGLSASASNSNALTVSVSGTTLSLTAKLHTKVSVRVIANDGNSQVQDDFTVTINSAPTVANAVADAGPLPAGQTLTVDMNNVFSDADSDYFTFNVTTSDAGVATVSWSDGTLTVTGVSLGSATITMTASDNYGGSVSDAFAVTVTAGGNAPPPDNNDPNDPPYQPPVVLGGGGSPPDNNDPNDPPYEPPVQVGNSPPVNNNPPVNNPVNNNPPVNNPVNNPTPNNPVNNPTPNNPVNNPTPNNPVNNPTPNNPVNNPTPNNPTPSNPVNNPTPSNPGTDEEQSDDPPSPPVQVGNSPVLIPSNPVPSNPVVPNNPVNNPTPSSPILNNPPVVANQISDLTIILNGTPTVPLDAVFSDPDGDALILTASSSSTDTVTVSVDGTTLNIGGIAAGTVTVTVTATDPGGLTFSDTFVVTVVDMGTLLERADADGSGDIGHPDYFAFVKAFGSTEPRFDFNGDGEVNIPDFLIFVNDLFGKSVN